jgi:hypothetical protein
MSRVRPQVGPTISLFPFLAVLLCTMGSLLVLLVLFSSSADQADAAAAAAAAREQEEELALAHDELAWRIQQLAGVKARTLADLARARMQLAGIEEDSRGLADDFEALDRQAVALEGESTDDERTSLADLEQRLAAAQQALDKTREAAADRPPAYAVVPYDGDSGTHRRPLYIECCIDGVFLQPEGIRLGPADFEGPPGPGNPLASGLRAAREYLARQPGETGDPAVQPYPLLLVRPSGVMAYYAAREALQSWGSDFGYQFIDEDWTLTFPPADSALAEAEMRAVEEARRRLEWLAQVRPPKRAKPAVQYRAATTRGGVVSTGGPSVLGDQSRWDWTEEQAAAAGAGRGFRAGGPENGRGDGQGDAVLGRGQGSGDHGPDARWTVAGGQAGSGDRFLGPSKFYDGSAGGGGSGATGDGGGEAGGVENGPGDDGVPGATGQAGEAGGRSRWGTESSTGDAAGELAAGGSEGGADAGPGGPSGAGTAWAGAEGMAGGGGAGSGSATSRASQAAAAGGGGSGPSLPGLSQSATASLGGPAAMADCSDGSCSLAGRRGSNWASLASQDRPVPLTRPIRLECAADEFRFLDAEGRVTSRVPIGTRTAAAVDPLVREVHATVGDWGMAGDRMYWRPELVLSATPDGGSRRADLEALLADSGLDTRRAEGPDPVRPLPPVHRTGALPPRP